MDYSFIPSVAKQKVRTITYKMKDVFEKKSESVFVHGFEIRLTHFVNPNRMKARNVMDNNNENVILAMTVSASAEVTRPEKEEE